MASVHLMCSSLLQQDPMIPWEAWFTVLLPCFYRAWLCKWSWWRPQPRVTEFSGTVADLQCGLKSLGHTHAFLTCSWKGLSEAPAELSQSSSSSPHEKESSYSPNFSHLTSPSKKPFEDVRTMDKLTWGWGKGERRSGSEWCCWNCSQPITHKTDSLPHQPAPPRSNEGNDGLHTTPRFIRASFTHSPFMGSKWAPETPTYEDGPA